MKFAFDDDQLAFAQTLAELLAKKCPPEAVRSVWQSEAGYLVELWQAMAELGVLAVAAPESHGGLGLGEVDLVKLLEEAGRAAAPVPLLEHAAVAIPALAQSSSSDLAETWLGPAVAGEVIITAAVSPADLAGGGDLGGGGEPASAATKSLVNYGAQADLSVLCFGGQLYALERGSCQAEEVESVDGSRRLAEVSWSPSDAIWLEGACAELAFDRGALASAAQCVGVAAHLLDTTVAYVGEREQFGKPVGSYQAVKHHLADVAQAVSFARPSVYAAAWAVSAVSADDMPPDERQRFVSAAKSLASDAADLAARKCLQCHGAIGYTYESDLHLWLKRAWSLSASWGDARWHRRRLAGLLGI